MEGTLLAQEFFPQFWEPVYSGAIEAQPNPSVQGRHYPIGSIGIPGLITSQLIAINVFNDALPETWRWGGVVRQAIDIGLIVGAATSATYASKSLTLNRLNLIAFPPISKEYKLTIDIPKWIFNINIAVWEYTGEVKSVFTRIEQINSKLDILMGM